MRDVAFCLVENDKGEVLFVQRGYGLDFVHLGGAGEDVGELSVNCGWGVFNCRGSTPTVE